MIFEFESCRQPDRIVKNISTSNSFSLNKSPIWINRFVSFGILLINIFTMKAIVLNEAGGIDIGTDV